MRGYVLAVGPKFFLLALLDDRVRFNGFECLRIRDVKGLKADPNAVFAEAALKKRDEHLPNKPRVSLATLAELLRSANRKFPLVTIHREQVDSSICNIGRVVGLGEKSVSLLEIGADAVWEKLPNAYRLNEITRVSFGGGYEDALFLVGGGADRANSRLQRTAASRPFRWRGVQSETR